MTSADKMLLLLLLFGIGVLFRLHWLPPSPANQVAVTGPQGRHVHALDETRRFSVAGALGDSELHIDNGRVRFVASPCRHKICVRSGWHQRAGAVAACVPNRISLVLLGQQGDLDAISY